jgi:hypothetical protein
LKAASNPQIIAFFLLTCWKTDATGKTQGQWWITFSGRSATEWPDAIAELHYNEKNGLNCSNVSEHLQEFDELWDWWETQSLAELSESEPREI